MRVYGKSCHEVGLGHVQRPSNDQAAKAAIINPIVKAVKIGRVRLGRVPQATTFPTEAGPSKPDSKRRNREK